MSREEPRRYVCRKTVKTFRYGDATSMSEGRLPSLDPLALGFIFGVFP
ncbi:hypothetical protein MIZ03_0149 [Rhodoferax lithotrophicus]|uniref:Uncharacterized protein n=1 Tax=Rhodoferax lithotrophicus TaxID=2798804 RepID=A0ABN6CZT1_9BURK|nr:hypothetical protein MIZ03_0149 [Rhodoferax sp. MIZ03]